MLNNCITTYGTRNRKDKSEFFDLRCEIWHDGIKPECATSGVYPELAKSGKPPSNQDNANTSFDHELTNTSSERLPKPSTLRTNISKSFSLT